MLWLKQSTAITVKIGPFVDETDGNTAETALTIAQADVRLSKNGGDIAQKTEATSCTHDELGIYGCPLDTTDTATLGRLQLWVHESGALPVWHEFMVVPANVWDSFFGADALQVHAIEITDGLITAAAIATDAIGSDELAATATAEIVDAIWDEDIVAAHNTADTAGALLDDVGTPADFKATGFSTHSAADAADAVWDEDIVAAHNTADTAGLLLDTDLATILADTNELQGDDIPGLIAALNDVSTAEVNAEVDTALADIHLDHLIQVASTVSDAAAAAGDFDTALAEATNDHYNDMIIVFTSGALAGQARRISDYDGTSKNVIITPAFTEAPANSDPFIILSGGYLKVVAERLDTQAKADVNAEADTALTDYDPPTNTEMEARTLVAASYFDPAADAVADVTLVATTTTNTDMRGTDSAALASVCTETRLAELAAANLPTDIDAVLADTNELQTDDIPGAISGLNDPTAATIADAVWDELATGHIDAGKAGQQLWTDLDAVLADTNELQTDDVPGLISALNDITVTDITQRQIPDSYAADGSLPTLEQALLMILQFLSERSVSGTTVTVKKPDGSTTAMTFTLDDDTDPTSITRAS